MKNKTGDDLFTSFDLTNGQEGTVVTPGAGGGQVFVCPGGILVSASQNIQVDSNTAIN